MNIREPLPFFDFHLPDLDRFILELVDTYEAGEIKTWENLEARVNSFFTSESMDQTESKIPGWKKMASYAGGMTLIHVMCVFLGLYMMPEFPRMTREQQQIMKWVILFHDIEKELPDGKRDHLHAFRSAIATARQLPGLGFWVTDAYDLLIDDWDRLTRSAITISKTSSERIQDNAKLPEILAGIERMFGRETPAAFIIKTILFHLSIPMITWPPPSPLTAEEIGRYIDRQLVPLLRAMNLGDSEGWNMFNSSREPLRIETLEAFQRVERLILNQEER